MSKEDMERLEQPTDEALIQIGQTCCHRMQIVDVADQANTAHILLNCALHGAISFDVTYDEGQGDKAHNALKEEITRALGNLTPRYKQGDSVRITSHTEHRGQVGVVQLFKERFQDMAGWVERYYVKFPGDEGVYTYDDNDFEPATQT